MLTIEPSGGEGAEAAAMAATVGGEAVIVSVLVNLAAAVDPAVVVFVAVMEVVGWTAISEMVSSEVAAGREVAVGAEVTSSITPAIVEGAATSAPVNTAISTTSAPFCERHFRW
ncbi:hypothetical protein chiPu_0000444 [Chiloscyllium punctatum]|uniref:Uncharacterized protein n=1 Tax=Chiloscyllium punctatum TaxID=137246 RepID=A0A401RV87_CHIPU|nr:hypothetical protein [Chiloscyllium punctatum]